MKDLLELVDLTSKREAYVQSLSRGMQQRLCLAHALVHDPLVLLLDEPASGLDPRARAELRELLRELSSLGKTIVISSHILPELEEMVSAVAIIDRGRVLASGTVADIQTRFQRGSVLRAQGARRTGRVASRLQTFFAAQPEVASAAILPDGRLELALPGDEEVAAALAVPRDDATAIACRRSRPWHRTSRSCSCRSRHRPERSFRRGARPRIHARAGFEGASAHDRRSRQSSPADEASRPGPARRPRSRARFRASGPALRRS